MKGIESWVWVIGGLVLAMILIGIALNVIYSISLQQDKNLADMEFSKIISVINSLCDSNVGQETTQSFRFPEIVEKIYASYDKLPPNLSETKGNNLCMNFTELKCIKLDCSIIFPLIKRKEGLLTFIDRISGKRVYYEYKINFIRIEEGVVAKEVSISENQTTTIITPSIYDFETLIEFNNNPILIRKNNAIIFLDATPFVEKDENLIKILEKICENYGNNIAIFWEDTCIWNKKILEDGSIWCPAQNEVKIEDNKIIRRLREKGCRIEIILHDKKIISYMLKDYDQIWLLRPGWCEISFGDFPRSTMDFCVNSVPWDFIEIREIKKYVEEGGKVVIFLDYLPNMNSKIANALLSNLKFHAKFVEGNVGSGKATKIYDSDITREISSYNIFGAAIIRPEN
ncbi:MAG: hypothetical protein QW758_00980 [Candidatus Aenigmatarchaeota archaeon]